MKFTIMARELADAVGWVSHALSRRPVVPVLGGILFEAGDDGVTLAAFDYDTSRRIAVELDAPIDGGRALLPGRVLVELVKALPKGDLVDVVADKTEAVIRCGRSKFALPLLPVDDFPNLPKMPDAVGKVDSKVLADAVARVAVAAGRDDSIPMITCVRVEIGDGVVDLAATDRYRLAWHSGLSWSPTLEQADSLGASIPAKTLVDIVRGFPAGPVEVCVSKQLAGFACDGRSATVRLLDDEFIKFKARMTVDTKVTAEVDAAELVKVVKRVALMAERHTPVRLSFTQDGVLVEAGNADVGRAAELVDCKLDGDDIQIAFQPVYLLDGIQAVGGTAKLEMESSTKPAMITGTGDAGLRYLVVPIRLSA